ncbi:hypothetical protein BJX61DRAFT_544941 [Aspergillus egyptiacus]|nr:hypothetical protein BJX61DRAFT_544941 [Aspergillus egyptiacus]
MAKGCKVCVKISDDDIWRLEGARVTVELKVYEYAGKDSDGARTYAYNYMELLNQDVKTENTVEWYYKLDANQIKPDGTEVNKGDIDLDYGQRWILDCDRESTAANPVDDSEAPRRGFRIDNRFDGTEICVNFMKHDGYIFLGKYDQGTVDVVPQVPIRVTISGRGSNDSFEFDFDPADPTETESRYTQTVKYHPAEWDISI